MLRNLAVTFAREVSKRRDSTILLRHVPVVSADFNNARLHTSPFVRQQASTEEGVRKTSILRMMLLLLIFLNLQTAESYRYCDSKALLRVGHQGVISCDFGEFDVVGWLYPTLSLETTEPFIYVTRSEIRGPESGKGEYSMFPNGSLVIKNVTLDHEKNYTARVVNSGAVTHHVVPVEVYVLPAPEYPVVTGKSGPECATGISINDGLSLHTVDGLTNQPHVVLDVNQGGELTCFKDGVSPNVNLYWELISPNSSDDLIMRHRFFNMCDIGICMVSSMLTIRPARLSSISNATLECIVSVGGFALWSTNVEVLFSEDNGQNKFPLVNGLDNQQHVVLHVNRTGTLTCSMDRVSPNVELEWKYINHDSSTTVTLQRFRQFSFDNRDGTYNITSVSRYKTISDLVQTVTVKCGVLGKAADFYSLYTTVELHFPTADSHLSIDSSQSKSALHVVWVVVTAIYAVFITLLCVKLKMRKSRKKNSPEETRYTSYTTFLTRFTIFGDSGD